MNSTSINLHGSQKSPFPLGRPNPTGMEFARLSTAAETAPAAGCVHNARGATGEAADTGEAVEGLWGEVVPSKSGDVQETCGSFHKWGYPKWMVQRENPMNISGNLRKWLLGETLGVKGHLQGGVKNELAKKGLT